MFAGAKLSGELGTTQSDLAKQKELSAQQIAQVELLNRQLAARTRELGASFLARYGPGVFAQRPVAAA